MHNIFDLVPKHKFDNANIEKLKTIEPDEAKPILEALMEWIQDLNWPVAQELFEILPRFHLQLVPVIHKIFNSNDEIWKYWTLELLKSFPQRTLAMLQSDLERMASSPTDLEKVEEVDKSAHEVLDYFYRISSCRLR